MKNIKLLTSIILSITFLATSCSSDNDGDESEYSSEYFMSYEINDNKIVYENIVSANMTYNDVLGTYGVGILGAESNTALSIYIYDTEPISTKTYTGEIIPDKYLMSALISYGTNTEGYTSASTILSTVANAQVVITEVNDAYIAGNFTGVLVANSDYNTVTHTIKNGKFKIKFMDQQT